MGCLERQLPMVHVVHVAKALRRRKLQWQRHVQTGWFESQKDPKSMSERTNCSFAELGSTRHDHAMFDMAMKPIEWWQWCLTAFSNSHRRSYRFQERDDLSRRQFSGIKHMDEMECLEKFRDVLGNNLDMFVFIAPALKNWNQSLILKPIEIWNDKQHPPGNYTDMRHSWLSTSSECFKSRRGKSRGIQKTHYPSLSLIRAANSHHNIPGMYSSILVVDTWLIHGWYMCNGSVLVNFSHCLAMYRPCSHYTPTITYLKFNAMVCICMYSTNWIHLVSLVFLGHRTTSHCSSMSNLHLQSLRATLQRCFLNQHQTTDWVPMEGSCMTQNIMFSNILKFATTMRENFDDLQILSSP